LDASTVLRRLVKLVVSDYAAYRIYMLERPASLQPDPLELKPADPEALAGSGSAILAKLSNWRGPNGHGFMLCSGGQAAAVCWYWWGEQYRTRRNFWPLAEGDAKLIELGVREDARGRGLAVKIVVDSAERMFTLGFLRLFARVWHSHAASYRAFERAGWRNVALVISYRWRWSAKETRIEFRQRWMLRAPNLTNQA